ncbi:hypothetical protein [Undibacterium sp. Ren11W]|uniref:hypothetical protein n=1 Tax=Undibacterium sp. Ren11W TaxID=3413045 RepID=UPI003BF15507
MKHKILRLGAVLACVLIAYNFLGAKKMTEIKLDIGKNIVETAKASGVPRFQVGSTAGMVSYSINQIPADITAHFIRPGYEISVAPLFSLKIYADEDLKNNLAVDEVYLAIDNKIKTHAAGQAFVAQLIAQFQRGKWQRLIDESCPAVTGRSSFLNAVGELDVMSNCALDPNYKLSAEEWLLMMVRGHTYQWLGDGVIAELEVKWAAYGAGDITYVITLTFKDFAIRTKRDAENEATRLKEGDAQGWNSTADSIKNAKETEIKIKLLEENALKRGDKVLAR